MPYCLQKTCTVQKGQKILSECKTDSQPNGHTRTNTFSHAIGKPIASIICTMSAGLRFIMHPALRDTDVDGPYVTA